MARIPHHRSTLAAVLVLSLAACGGGGGGGGGGTPSTPLIAPNGGEVWGGMKSISWNPTGATSVLIELSGDAGATYPTVLAAAAPDNGSFPLDTTAFADAQTYRVRITPAGASPFASAGNFAIDNTDPVISLTAPVGGENWSQVRTITWTTTDANPGTVQIRLSSNSGSTYPTIVAAAAPDTGAFNWNTASLADGVSYRISITPTDKAGNVGVRSQSAADFTLDNTLPTVVLTSPTGGENWTGVQTITWTTTDDFPNVVDLRLSSDSGATFPTVIASQIADSGSFSWATANVPDGFNYRVRVIAYDLSGNASLPSSSTSDIVLVNLRLVGRALFSDENFNAILDAGDLILMAFDKNIVLNGPTPGDLAMAVAGDSLGSGAFIGPGPLPNELLVTLGTNPLLKSRQIFEAGVTVAGSPSGIDISATMTPNAIETATGVDASPSGPLDIIPAFTNTMQALGTTTTATAAAGDLDGDGDVDFVAGVLGGPNLVYTNNGSGTFVDSGQALGSSQTSSLALADLDRDGDLDLVEAALVGEPNRVWRNDGTGTFTDTGQLLGVGTDTREVAVGDLDGDGDLDLLFANDTGQPNLLFVNDGAGLFSAGPVTPGTQHTTTVALGDLDTDGDLDAIIGNDFAGETNRVWLNNGFGNFIDVGMALNTANTRDIVLADFDSDGDLDAYIATSGQNQLALNNGSGIFVDSGRFYGNNDTRAVRFGDIDDDGDLDVVEGKFDDSNRAWFNDGTGFFTDSGQTIGTASTSDIELVDVNGDGDLDLISVNENNQPDRIWSSALAGTWGGSTFVDSGQTLGSNATRSVAIADLDQDGDLDFAEGNLMQANRIWRNDGSGTFADSGQALGSAATEAIAVGDVDRDGDPDLVEAVGGAANRIWLNNGIGAFVDSGQALGNADTRAVAIGDLNADGLLDLVFGNAAPAQDSIYLNTGGGVFFVSAQVLGTGDTRSIALADVDGDSDLDMIVGNRGGANRVWTNDGSATFTDSGQSLGSSNTEAIAAGDVDQDGDLDFVAANDGAANTVWSNDGSGVFSNIQAFSGGSTRDVRLVDVDGDGDLDAVFGNANNEANLVFLNNGAGSFSDSGQALGNGATESIGLADVDQDGDLDIVAGNESGANRVWLNE